MLGSVCATGEVPSASVVRVATHLSYTPSQLWFIHAMSPLLMSLLGQCLVQQWPWLYRKQTFPSYHPVLSHLSPCPCDCILWCLDDHSLLRDLDTWLGFPRRAHFPFSPFSLSARLLGHSQNDHPTFPSLGPGNIVSQFLMGWLWLRW